VALFFDHMPGRPLRFLQARDTPRLRMSTRHPAHVPHHICLRLVAGWLAALALLFALMLAIRWFG
jgi:hypothetical protein